MAPAPKKTPAAPDRRAHDGWHLEKSVSISHIIATITVLLSLGTWLATMDKRVAVLENNVSTLSANEKDSLARIDSALIRIETKLDDKADKREVRR